MYHSCSACSVGAISSSSLLPPSALASSSSSGAAWHRRTLSTTLIDESVAAAAELVQRWHPDDTPTSTTCSLFLNSGGGDHNIFLSAAADLHQAMLFFASHSHDDGGLDQAQELLQTAMRRLDMELRLVLDYLDDHDRIQVMISNIVGAMMAAGYGKECLSTFKSTRRAALASKLGNSSYLKKKNSMNKLGWEQVDANIIQPWLAVASVAFNSLFPAEKELCHAVFKDNNAAGVGEAVFAGIVNDHAMSLLVVAEAAVARARHAPERLFRVLDVHHTLVNGERKIQSVFNKDEVATRAGVVIAKAAEAARAILISFEAAILIKEPPSNTTPGGAVHPLTSYVMNYLVFLAEDYTSIIINGKGKELEDWIWRLVSALLSKLESKAGSYREAALTYLFLANNTHYVATKVRGSSKLQEILGHDWGEAQSAKARGHVHVYTRAAWGRLISFISSPVTTEDPPQTTGLLVMEAVQMQEQWMAADQEIAKLLRFTATAAVLPKYRIFYRRFGAALSLTPGDVNTMIAALFTNLPVPASQPHDPNEMSVTY